MLHSRDKRSTFSRVEGEKKTPLILPGGGGSLYIPAERGRRGRRFPDTPVVKGAGTLSVRKGKKELAVDRTRKRIVFSFS